MKQVDLIGHYGPGTYTIVDAKGERKAIPECTPNTGGREPSIVEIVPHKTKGQLKLTQEEIADFEEEEGDQPWSTNRTLTEIITQAEEDRDSGEEDVDERTSNGNSKEEDSDNEADDETGDNQSDGDVSFSGTEAENEVEY